MNTSPNAGGCQLDSGNSVVSKPKARIRDLPLWILSFILILFCGVVGWKVFRSFQLATFGDDNSGFSVVINGDGVHCFGCDWSAGELDPSKTPYVTRPFTILNQLNEEITIDKVSTSCGCLLVENAPKKIPPGKSIEVDVRYTVGDIPGPIQRQAKVAISSPIAEDIVFNVYGQVVPSAILYGSSEAIDFGTVKPGETEERSVRLYRFDGSDVNFVSSVVTPEVEGVTFEFLPRESASTQYLTIRIQSKEILSRSVRFNGSLQIKTDHPSESDLEIPIKAHCQGADVLFVKAISINVNRNVGTKTVVELCPQGKTIAEIPAVESVLFEGSRMVKASLVASKNEAATTLPKAEIEWQEEFATDADILNGGLKLNFKDNNLRELRIPVVIRVDE